MKAFDMNDMVFILLVLLVLGSLFVSCSAEKQQELQQMHCARENKTLIQDWNERPKWFCGTYSK